MEVVLYNSIGCELAREVAENHYEVIDIISKWTIEPGDNIKIY